MPDPATGYSDHFDPENKPPRFQCLLGPRDPAPSDSPKQAL